MAQFLIVYDEFFATVRLMSMLYHIVYDYNDANTVKLATQATFVIRITHGSELNQ